LRFLILCAGRSNEIMGADWNEIDEKRRLWIVPPSRMKLRRQHRVPLSDEAMALLPKPLPPARPAGFLPKGWKPTPTPLIKQGRVFNIRDQHGLRKVLSRLGVDATTHGFRSSFRQFCGERTAFPRNVIELSLAHKVAINSTEDAYCRDPDLI